MPQQITTGRASYNPYYGRHTFYIYQDGTCLGIAIYSRMEDTWTVGRAIHGELIGLSGKSILAVMAAVTRAMGERNVGPGVNGGLPAAHVVAAGQGRVLIPADKNAVEEAIAARIHDGRPLPKLERIRIHHERIGPNDTTISRLP